MVAEPFGAGTLSRCRCGAEAIGRKTWGVAALSGGIVHAQPLQGKNVSEPREGLDCKPILVSSSPLFGDAEQSCFGDSTQARGSGYCCSASVSNNHLRRPETA